LTKGRRRNSLPDEKVSSMKALYFCTILVFVALSTNVGFAGHRGHHSNVDNRVHAPGTAAPGQAKPAAEGPQSSAPSRAASDQINHGAAKDSAGSALAEKSGKPATETSSPRVKTPTNPDVPADTAPTGASGQPHLVTHGNGAKENGAGASIDARITVHQGRQAPNSNEVKEIRDLKERLFKMDPTHRSIHNHQQTSPLATDGAPVRNAVGANIEQRTAGSQSIPPTPSNATGQVSSGKPTTGIQVWGERSRGTVSTSDPDVQLNGTVRPDSARPSQFGNHPSKTTALTIVTANSPAVNGTGMIRPGSSSGAVGGPAKVVTGAIGGSSFRPKHP
jgi:hypothetical protein